jgi:hypothetical protein
MKVKAIIEITGDFGGKLSDKIIEEVIDAVISDGAEANCLSSDVEILEIIEN